MIDLQAIFHHEMYFCKSFTRTQRTEYGVLFYNAQNSQSHDSNHAHIVSFDHALDDVIQDIIRFYQRKHLTPRIYASFRDREVEVLHPRLAAHGFTISTYQNIFMHGSTASVPRIDTLDVSFRRISTLSQDIIDLIHTDEAGDWTIHVLHEHLQDERFHLLGLYLENTCRAIASVKIMQTYSRVDMVYLQAYHARVSTNEIYLWANNPIAIKLYKNIGFQEFPIGKPCWSAWLSDHATRS